MTDNHPITPPQWQVDAWHKQAMAMGADVDAVLLEVFRAGADQELEACVEWLISNQNPIWATALQEGRRPEPPSLKEQAQRILVENGTTIDGRIELDLDDIFIIRRALEALDG